MLAYKYVKIFMRYGMKYDEKRNFIKDKEDTF